MPAERTWWQAAAPKLASSETGKPLTIPALRLTAILSYPLGRSIECTKEKTSYGQETEATAD